MNTDTKISIETFKVVTKAIAHSDSLDLMSNHLTQLLVAALNIKGCAIFILNPESEELEILASFGLSADYLTKGPLNAPRSIAETYTRKPVIVPDVSKDEHIQYPQEAIKEGIKSILGIPIIFLNEVLGSLRLYNDEVWNISGRDLDSLHILTENIGLAMTYTRLLNAIKSVSEIIDCTLPAKVFEELKEE